jgi:hypothetical protein
MVTSTTKSFRGHGFLILSNRPGFFAVLLTFTLMVVFNFDKPILIILSYPGMGIMSVFSIWYFEKYKNITISQKFGFLGNSKSGNFHFF